MKKPSTWWTVYRRGDEFWIGTTPIAASWFAARQKAAMMLHADPDDLKVTAPPHASGVTGRIAAR